MYSQQNQPIRLPRLLLALVLFSVVLLIPVGGGLFFFPEFFGPLWPWALTPFNLRFLGAIYLTSLVGLLSLVLAKRASPVRLILPMMWVFTTVVLLVSCLHLEQFAPTRRITDIWFWLYFVDCVGTSYYMGYSRQQTLMQGRRLPTRWSVGLSLQAGLIGAYGLGLLIFPETTSSAWSWPLDTFHARLYSAIFLAGAVASALLSRHAQAIECRALGLVQVTFSLLVIAGMWVVDRAVDKIDWSLGSNWLWLLVMALFGIVGLGLIYQSQSDFWNRTEP
ncbi:MAG: hypothetical protein AAFY72_00795 [Cyanobacteria bacterium J06649_4]